jgi:hypothetical protein
MYRRGSHKRRASSAAYGRRKDPGDLLISLSIFTHNIEQNNHVATGGLRSEVRQHGRVYRVSL